MSCIIRTFTFSSFLFGLQLHSLSLKLSLSTSPFSGSALVYFYANNSRPIDALKVFDEIRDRDEVCYGAAIVGLAQNERPMDAIWVFRVMREEGVGSTMYSVSGALRAAAHLAALEQTRMMHAHAVVVGLDLGIVVGTALVDAYGKSGVVVDARRMFDWFVGEANLITWNAMLAAYAQQGDAEETVQLFKEMTQRRCFVPDEYSFLAVLTACSNAGLVGETRQCLDLMHSHYRLEPRIEHYTCLVGAMARVGQLEDAESFVRTMPFKPDAAMWRTLLSGCMVHSSVELGEKVAQQLIELNLRDESAYVILANIYSAVGRKDEMAEVWVEMRDQRVKKERGRSWIEVKGKVHEFIAGDIKHERTIEIYEEVRVLANEVKMLGYMEEDEGVWYHSERLALAFSVVSGSAMEGKALRVLKNLRICRDCHEFFKYASRVLAREIVVRDVNRYHKFQKGGCSCRDYW